MIEKFKTQKSSSFLRREPMTTRTLALPPEVIPELFIMDDGFSGQDILLLESPDDALLLE